MSDELQQLHVVAGRFSGKDHVESFRETYGRALMQLEIDPHPDHPLELDFAVTGFCGFGLASGCLSQTTNRHTAAMLNDDDIVLVHTPRGHGTLGQMGRELTLRDGEATFLTNAQPALSHGHARSRLCNFRFSRAMLGTLAGETEDRLAQHIPAGHPVLRLLTRYADIVHDGTALATPEMRRSVSSHLHDLAALMLQPTGDRAELARSRGLRAARLRAVKEDIAARLTDRALSLEALARRHAIAPRTLRALFRAEGTSFTDHVLAERLARAHRMLCDPRLAGHNISAIAYDCGFGDLSYFNHAFRRRYQATPSDVRAAAQP